MKPMTIHADADQEVWAAATYYESQRDGLGREFVHEFEAVVQAIQDAPGSPEPIDERGTRRRRLRRFPYTVYYVELDEMVWIAAVAHQRRRPGYWSRRKPTP